MQSRPLLLQLPITAHTPVSHSLSVLPDPTKAPSFKEGKGCSAESSGCDENEPKESTNVRGAKRYLKESVHANWKGQE